MYSNYIPVVIDITTNNRPAGVVFVIISQLGIFGVTTYITLICLIGLQLGCALSITLYDTYLFKVDFLKKNID